MDRAVVEVPGHDAGATAIIGHDQVKREVFDEELGVVAQRLPVERMQDGMACAVGSGAGALYRRTGTKVLHVPAERALVDLALFVTGERHAVVFQLVDGLRRFHGKILHGIDVAEPIGALDGVVEMPLPAVRRHVLQRGGDTALRRNRVRAGREHLRDAGRLEALFRHAERRTQSSSAGSHDNDVVGVVDIGIGLAVLRNGSDRCHGGIILQMRFSERR